MIFHTVLYRIFRFGFLLNAFCGVVLLFAPIVWMKIGPIGKEYYGPTVPDIWIYGGSLTGKDLSFEPLAIIMLTQLATILTGIFLSIVAFVRFHNRAAVTVFSIVMVVLLSQFPSWIDWYMVVIRGNSDGAPDITDVEEWGWTLYVFIFVSTIICFCGQFLLKRNDVTE